jgi:hypothetical protein
VRSTCLARTLPLTRTAALTIANSGQLTANNYYSSGTSLTINGNVNNGGFLPTADLYGQGNNALTIAGNLNNYELYLYGNGDTVQVNGNLAE